MKIVHMVLFAVFCGMAGGAFTARAADAVFSQDGGKVYFATGKLKMLDLAKPDHLDVLTSSPLFGGEDIIAITRADKGAILCLSEHHLAAYDPQTGKFTKKYDAATGEVLNELAFNSQDSILLVTMTVKAGNDTDVDKHKITCFRRADPKPIGVFSRRVFDMMAPIFDEQGNLYFSYRGDLWIGNVVFEALEKEDRNKPGEERGVLNGIRVAPLARLETYEGTPMSLGVEEIAIAGSELYLHNQRLGGTGWGTILSMLKPEEEKDRNDRGYKMKTGAHYQDFIRVLSSVKEIAEAGETVYLCASPDGNKVFYYLRDNDVPSYWLIENGGKARRLPITGIFLENF